jgi:hypothetical protein
MVSKSVTGLLSAWKTAGDILSSTRREVLRAQTDRGRVEERSNVNILPVSFPYRLWLSCSQEHTIIANKRSGSELIRNDSSYFVKCECAR